MCTRDEVNNRETRRRRQIDIFSRFSDDQLKRTREDPKQDAKILITLDRKYLDSNWFVIRLEFEVMC